jgi:hypothetical protein
MMKTTFWKTITRSLMAAGLGVGLLGGTAYANDTAAIAKEMAKGKDYDAAWNAVRLAKPGLTGSRAESREHARQMSKGKDHWAIVPGGARVQAPSDAAAARHAYQMSLGKDHAAAWDAERALR